MPTDRKTSIKLDRNQSVLGVSRIIDLVDLACCQGPAGVSWRLRSWLRLSNQRATFTVDLSKLETETRSRERMNCHVGEAQPMTGNNNTTVTSRQLPTIAPGRDEPARGCVIFAEMCDESTAQREPDHLPPRRGPHLHVCQGPKGIIIVPKKVTGSSSRLSGTALVGLSRVGPHQF